LPTLGAAAEKTRKRKQKNGERIQAILEKREKKEKKSQERQKFFKEGAAVFKRLLTSTKALTMTGKDKIESVNSAQVGKIVKSVQARTGIKKNPAVQSMKANANMPTYSSTGNDCCDCMNMFLIIGELKNQNARSGGRRANKSGSRGVRSKPGKTRYTSKIGLLFIKPSVGKMLLLITFLPHTQKLSTFVLRLHYKSSPILQTIRAQSRPNWLICSTSKLWLYGERSAHLQRQYSARAS
jgi:hypothetical protein